jgi:hypothetical protein
MFVSLGSAIIAVLYKLTVSDQVQVSLQLILFFRLGVNILAGPPLLMGPDLSVRGPAYEPLKTGFY